MQVPGTRLRAAAVAALLVTSTVISSGSPATAAAATTRAGTIIAVAESHLGAPWVYAATGPYAYDCSGLVYDVFRDTGYFYVIGNGRYRTVGAMWNLFAARGLASTHDPLPGDLVVYGGGSHIGIYIGGGKVISALVSGVAIHGLYAVTAPFTTFLHTGMYRPAIVMTYFSYVRSGPSYGYGATTSVAAGRQLPVLAFRTDSTGRTWAQVLLPSGATGWIEAWRGRGVGFMRVSTTTYVRSGPATWYSVVEKVLAGSTAYSYNTTSNSSRSVWMNIRGPATRNFLSGQQIAP